MITRRSAFGLLLGTISLGLPMRQLHAEPLMNPGGKPVLKVSGKITQTNNADEAVFDMSMLETLQQASIRTTTPWFNGPVTFSGVPLTSLMQALGAVGTTLVVSSLNDYTSELPIDDFIKFGPILAIKRDGSYMPINDKGPLFIVYPYDSSPELNKQKYFSRSPWQVARMKVV